MKISDEANYEQQIIDLRNTLRKAQLAEAKAKLKTADYVEAVFEAARTSLLATPRPAIIAPVKDKRKTKAEVALVHLTDWQAGKQTVSYDISVLETRIADMIRKVIQLTDIQRAHHPVKECVVMLGGDMVEGLGIFPGQQYEVGAHLYEQMFAVVRIIESSIRTLATNFESVKVVCEFGNHGRLGRKGDMPAGDNIDRIAYQIASNNCADFNSS